MICREGSLYRSGRFHGSCLGCLQVYQERAVRASKACPASHTLSSSLQSFKVTISFLDFFLAAPLLRDWLMPSVNYLSATQCSH